MTGFHFRGSILQDVAAQILILHDVGKLLVDVGGVDLNVFLFKVRSFEGKLIQNLFEDRVETAGANIFSLLVDAGGEFRDGFDGVVGDVELEAFGFEQRDVLLDERVFRLGEDADEVFFLQGLELDANRQTALKFGNQVRRLGDMKRTGGDKENMIGADHAVA